MKKIKLLFILLASTLIMQAQTNTYQISATVLTNNYQNFVPNYPVIVIDSASGPTGSVQVHAFTTDSNGQFTDSITTVGTTGTLWFMAPDSCGFTTVALGYSPNSPSTLATAGLVLCNNIVNTGANCNYTVSALPVAGFPNQALFSYTGQSGSSYLWDFGDGNTSNQPAPFHTYAQPGTYYYCLTIDSCAPVCDSITVFGGGGCDPFFFPVINGSTVDIYPSLLTGQFVAIVDWGDGIVDTFTPQNIPNLPATINHTYATPGNYAICFTHSNASLGCSNTHCDTVAVSGSSNPSILCNAEFIVDTVNSLQGNVVVWNTSSATLNGTGQLSTSFFWDFGDGTSSSAQFPTHNYANPGLYSVCLTMTSILAPSGTNPGDTCVSTYCDSLGMDANGNLIYKGAATGWTLRVLDPNSIGIEEKALGNIKTYPNPVNDVLKIDLPLDLEAEVELSIFSMSGALLNQETIEAGTSSHQVDVANLPSGMYMMQIRLNGITKQVKIVKQ